MANLIDKKIAGLSQLLSQAFSLLQAGKGVEAMPLFDKILEVQPDQIDALNGRAFICFEQGDWLGAGNHIRNLLRLNPNDPLLYMRMGLIELEGKHYEEACTSFRSAVRIKPGYADALYKLGTTLLFLGNIGAAADALRSAIRFKPGFADSYNHLGYAMWRLGDKKLARNNFERAIQLKPDYVEALHNLGILLRDEKDFQGAERYLTLAVKFNPALAEARSNLGLTLALAGKTDEALAEFLEAIRLAPDQGNYYCNLGRTLMLQGRLTDAEKYFRQSIVLSPHLMLTYNSLFYLLLLKGDYSSMLELFQDFQEIFEDQYHRYSRFPALSRDRGKRLKVGYLSADFRAHPVGFFFEPIIKHHNRENFEVFCYYNDDVSDEQTGLIRASSDHWRDCLPLDNDQLAKAIADDGIDILVDLTGHFTGQRLEVLARKPAPIQMHYLGYPGSLGLKSVDFRVTDAYTDPPGAEHAYLERLLRLPGSLWCYQPSSRFPEIKQPPLVMNGFITFASLNNYNKIDEETISMWAALLHAVPNAILTLVTVPEGEARRDLQDKFAAAGIPQARLKFIGKLPKDDFLKTIQDVDIALDPVLVQGATTTCEVLWSGVPTISLVGNSYASRAGLSILSAAGFPELLFYSREEFVAGGKALAADIDRLVNYRDTMRQQVEKSSLCDAETFTRKLESLYREAWLSWCTEPSAG